MKESSVVSAFEPSTNHNDNDNDYYDDDLSFEHGQEELDLTTDEISLDEVDEDLNKFQQDEVVKEALQKGVDLRHYSRQIERQLKTAEYDCINTYMEQGEELATLYSQIKSCDGILATMQSMLNKFQGELGDISQEIQDLQDRSVSMNIKLKNREAAEERLSSVLQHLVITPELQRAIMEGEVGPDYGKWLMQLHTKLEFVERREIRESKAAQEVRPLLERMRLKAVAKVRAWLLDKFHGLKKPNTHIPTKQGVIVRGQFLYQFIVDHAQDRDSDLGASLRGEYIKSLSEVYAAKFKLYLANLKKVTLDSSSSSSSYSSHLMSKHDLLGVEESQGGLFSAKRSSSQITKMFSLGQRDSVLTDVEKDPVVTHVAEKSGQKFPYERCFRSILTLLMETASAEHDFLVSFFGQRRPDKMLAPSDGEKQQAEIKQKSAADTTPPPSSSDPSSSSSSSVPAPLPVASSSSAVATAQAKKSMLSTSIDRAMFTQIFAKTFSVILEQLEDFLFSTHDAIGLLLMIRILAQSNLSMQQKRLHCLDAFFDRLNMMLWPKFKSILDANLESVQKCPPTINNKKITKPHFVAYRHAEFSAAINRLNQGYNDEILTSNLRRLCMEVDKLFMRCASRIKTPKQQVIYLINNYNTITATLKSRNLECEDLAFFSEKAESQISMFVEEELSEKFGRLINFTKEMEQKKDEAKNDLDDASVESIAKHFNKSWKDGIEHLHGVVTKHFAPDDSKSASPAEVLASTEILRKVLVQLVLYYNRFLEFVREAYKSKPNTYNRLVKEEVSVQTIMHEIKRYAQPGSTF